MASRIINASRTTYEGMSLPDFYVENMNKIDPSMKANAIKPIIRNILDMDDAKACCLMGDPDNLFEDIMTYVCLYMYTGGEPIYIQFIDKVLYEYINDNNIHEEIYQEIVKVLE